MDQVDLNRRGRQPLHIRSGHTPENIGLLLGSLLAAGLAFTFTATQSAAVNRTLPPWAAWTFYGVLFVSAAIALSAVWQPLPHYLDDATYRTITSRLVRERIGLYGVAGIMTCFAVSSMIISITGTTAAAWLLSIAGGMVLRARQTAVDVNKLHAAVKEGGSVDEEFVADPDEPA